MDKQERRQDHFNKAYLGVIAQGGPAVRHPQGGNLLCMYLTPSGSKCGVGHTMSETELQKYGDYMGCVDDLWSEMKDEDDADENHPFYEDSGFYRDLQGVHDDGMDLSGEVFLKDFKEGMQRLADSYNLTVPDETATA